MFLLLYSSITFGQRNIGGDTSAVIFIYSDTSCKVTSTDTTNVFSDNCLLDKPGFVVYWMYGEEYLNRYKQPMDKRYKIWGYTKK